MLTGATDRFVWAVVFVMVGVLASNSFAGEAKALGLSKALTQVELFAGLTDAERDALKAAATLRRGKEGERIIQQGTTMDKMFIILEGKAEVRINGRHVVTLSGQSLVGEIEFLDMFPASADVLLLEETDLIELNYSALTGLIEKQPRLGYVLMRKIAGIEAKRLRDTSAKATETSPEARKLLDMTYTFDEKTIYWPTAEPFKLEKLDWGVSKGGWWYASNNYSASEHGGTHVDAPIHFAENGKTIEQIPLSDWIGSAVKIDVVSKCMQNRDYLLTVEDIKQWEKQYGKIPDNAWVLMYTGIDTKFYPDKKKVLGTEKSGKEALFELSFPGFSVEAIEYLLNARNIKGIGLDTPSIDYGKSKDFKVHQIWLAANKLAIENIANLDKLPAKGATLYALPMLIRDGTGAPARIFGMLP